MGLHALRERITRFVVVDSFFSFFSHIVPSTRVICLRYGNFFGSIVSLNVSLPFAYLHLSEFIRMTRCLRLLRPEPNSKFL